MKQILWIAVAGLMLVGCGQKEETAPAAPAAPAVEAPKAVEPAKLAEPAAPAPAPSVTQKLTETVKEVAQQATGKYAALLNAFQGSDASTMATVQQAVGALQGGKWSDAMPLLQQLLTGNLTGEQKQGVQDTMVDAQKEAASSAANQATQDASKSIQDATKSLPFGK